MACSFLLLCGGVELVQSSLVGSQTPSYPARAVGSPFHPLATPSEDVTMDLIGWAEQRRVEVDMLRTGAGSRARSEGKMDSLFLMRVSTDHIADLGHSGS